MFFDTTQYYLLYFVLVYWGVNPVIYACYVLTFRWATVNVFSVLYTFRNIIRFYLYFIMIIIVTMVIAGNGRMNRIEEIKTCNKNQSNCTRCCYFFIRSIIICCKRSDYRRHEKGNSGKSQI